MKLKNSGINAMCMNLMTLSEYNADITPTENRGTLAIEFNPKTPFVIKFILQVIIVPTNNISSDICLFLFK